MSKFDLSSFIAFNIIILYVAISFCVFFVALVKASLPAVSYITLSSLFFSSNTAISFFNLVMSFCTFSLYMSSAFFRASLLFIPKLFSFSFFINFRILLNSTNDALYSVFILASCLLISFISPSTFFCSVPNVPLIFKSVTSDDVLGVPLISLSTILYLRDSNKSLSFINFKYSGVAENVALASFIFVCNLSKVTFCVSSSVIFIFFVLISFSCLLIFFIASLWLFVSVTFAFFFDNSFICSIVFGWLSIRPNNLNPPMEGKIWGFFKQKSYILSKYSLIPPMSFSTVVSIFLKISVRAFKASLRCLVFSSYCIFLAFISSFFLVISAFLASTSAFLTTILASAADLACSEACVKAVCIIESPCTISSSILGETVVFLKPLNNNSRRIFTSFI